MHNASPVAALRRDRLLIWVCIALLTALAWTYLVYLDRQMSSSMAHDRMMAEMGMTMDMPRTATDLFFTFAMWTVMTPSAWVCRMARIASAVAGR